MKIKTSMVLVFTKCGWGALPRMVFKRHADFLILSVIVLPKEPGNAAMSPVAVIFNYGDAINYTTQTLT
jgi:hypothetical protein